MKLIVLSKRKLTLIIGIILSAMIFVISTAGISGAFSAGAKRELPIYRVKTLEKKIAISFDCAWGVDYTDELLSIMDKNKVKCTFFMVEFWAKKYPEYVKKIDDFGHEIGTHSATHPYMSKLNKSAIEKEFSTSIEAIKNVTGKNVNLFRPPYGDYNNLLIQTAREHSLYSIQWDVDSLDWKDLSKEEIENRVLSRVKEGSIVLFHNNGKNTSKALTKIILELKNKGYEFVRIGDLIYKDNFYMANDGEQIYGS